MKKLISMVIVISLMCSATMAFANGIETEEETVNCEIIEEQHNIDVNQGITGFGNIDVECCENISEEDEKDCKRGMRGQEKMILILCLHHFPEQDGNRVEL